ncbi:MAG TPA: trypsin-like peptidase domain-containing protein [Actinomycetota bacterium]|nr:trypsin-like peptidase domain-containing protein [Actinomycetota bacterium]
MPSAFIAVLAALALLASGIGIGWGLRGSDSRSPVVVGSRDETTQEFSTREIAERVSPAVVSIYTATAANPFSSEGRQRQVPRGAGTGMLLTSSGQVLTANHVVSGSTSITVEIDGRAGRYSARVVGAAPSTDVALLQIEDVSGLPTVRIGDSRTVQEGDEVVAIGNARGRGPQVSSGTVTALNRTIVVGDGGGVLGRLNDLIQVSTLIEEGQSGGPILNSKAEVVGMITAARRAFFRDETSRTAFAIPSAESQRIVNEVRAGRASSTVFIGPVGYMGISADEVGPGIAGRLGLSTAAGVLVVNVYAGGPAAEAEIPQGSVITAIDGRTVRSVQALSSAIHVHKPGETIRVTWVDPRGTHEADVTLVAGPAV